MAELFVNPMMLWGAALASAPVIIHLLNKRRYRVHSWAAMDFLFAAMASNRRRLKFEDLLLLLLRMLLILFVVFAVARPVIRGLAGWREDERVVVLDDSFSMEVVGPTGPVFQVAREAAIQQIRDAVGGSTPVSFWVGSDPLDVIGEISADVRGGTLSDTSAGLSGGGLESAGAGAGADEGLASAIAGKRLLDRIRESTTSDLPLEFAEIVRGIVEEAKEETAPRVRTIVLISDFRSSDWIDEDGSLEDSLEVVFEEIRKQDLQESLRFQFVDVGLPTAANIAVTDLRLEESPLLVGVTTRISVEVTNFGGEARVGINGDLLVRRSRSAVGSEGVGEPSSESGTTDSGEEVTHSIPLPTINTIEPGESVRVEVLHSFEEAGEFLLTASLESVRLGRDNESYLVAVVRDSLNALVVDGAPSADRFASESVHLLAALSPRGDVPSGVSARRVDGAFSATDLAEADVVFLLNRSEITEAERDVLEDFAESGGGLAWFVGNQIDSVAYRSLALVPSSAVGRLSIFPASLREVREPPRISESFRWSVEDFEHPVFALFRGMRNPPFEQVIFRRFFALDPVDGARVLARYDDATDESAAGTPAIIESRVVVPSKDDDGRDGSAANAAGSHGAGRVVLFNTSADRDWSDWPTDYTYPILLQEWTRYLAKPTGGERVRKMRDVLVIPDDPGMRYRILAPRGQESGVGPATSGGRGAQAADESSLEESGSDVFEFEVPNIDTIDPERAPTGARQFQPRRAGFYRLLATPRADAVVRESEGAAKQMGSRSTDEWFAFRRRSTESDLEALGEDRLREALEPFDLRYTIGGEVEVDAFRREQEGEVWRYLAFAAGLFLLLELFVAWWFGRRA